MKKYILTTIILLLSAVVNTTWAQKDINDPSITVTIDPATYNGAAQVPTVTVTDGSTTLTEGTDYTISYKGSTLQDAKTYVDEIIITGKNNYSGIRYASFKIDPKGVTGLTATAAVPYVDGGYANAAAVIAKPWTVVVKDGTTPISSDLYDVTLATGAYTNAGIYPDVVTITFKEGQNYAGTIITDLNMTSGGIDIASALVTSTAVYNGTTQAPSSGNIIVRVGESLLVYDTDFTFDINGKADDYEHAQTYSDAIIIRGKGQYYGTTIADYVILPCPISISLTTITVDDIIYSAEAHNTKSHVSIKIDDNVISNTNYTVTPESVTEAGTYTLTITGLANPDLIGSTTATLKVKKSMIDPTYSVDFKYTEIPTQIYKGEQLKPAISVYDNGRLLIEGEEYTITYGDNTITEGASAGIGTITITGQGAYDPDDTPTTVTKEFAIVNEYFTEGGITYHATSSTTVSVGKGEAVTTLTGVVAIPAKVALEVILGETITPITFQVTGIEAGAFKNCTDITGIVMPHDEVLYLEEIEDGAFEGCTNLRYIDLCNATNFTPSSLQRNIEASPFYGVPKQALVYLNGTTFKGENYVYKPGTGSDYFCELFKIYDDLNGSQTGFDGNDYKWAFENRHDFTAYNVENTRMLTADNHYTTCLPYDLPIPTGMKAYTLEATSDKLFGFKEVTGTLTKFTPYVLIPTKSGQLLGSNNNTVIPAFQPATDADATKLNGVNPTNSNFTFYGTMRYMEGADAAGKYIMQYKDNKSTWLSIDEGSAGFTNTDNRACILPMRAYIASTTGPARSYTATFTDIDGIIRTETFTLDDEDIVIYDLQGRKVQGELQRGVYIVNGKKVMVK